MVALCLMIPALSLAQNLQPETCTIKKGSEVIMGVMFEDGDAKVAAGILTEDCKFVKMETHILPWPPGNEQNKIPVAAGIFDKAVVEFEGKNITVDRQTLERDFNKGVRSLVIFTPLCNITCKEKDDSQKF